MFLASPPRTALLLDAAWRLGPRPVAWALAGRALRRVAASRLADAPLPEGPFLPSPAGPLPPEPERLEAAARIAPPIAPTGFDPAQWAALLDPLAGPDIRPVWEAARWAELPLLALAARMEPEAGYLARAEGWIAAWLRLNPPYRGPNWACGQEAGLRALHLALATAILGGSPGSGATALARLLDRRIAANPAYALAQDNNHPISEAAGRLACALLTRDAPAAARHSRAIDRRVARLIAEDGGFAQDSPAYLRLALDVLSVTEELRLAFHGPRAAPRTRERAAAAARLLARLACPESGALPRFGHQDSSCFADLALAGAADARASIARALGRFGAEPPADEPGWCGAGLRLWRAGRARAVLRLPGRRFRPGHADALHLDLWDGAAAVLSDSGTGAYNPAPADRWWLDYFPSTMAHNTIEFDGQSQMPRLTRFLSAFWPEGGATGSGGWMRDHRGNCHRRHVEPLPGGRRWRVTDEVSGPFQALALRWHLPPDLAGPSPRIEVTADAPVSLGLEAGWESPAYGLVRPRPVLVARAPAPISRLTSVIALF
jgi:hypothetical protein